MWLLWPQETDLIPRQKGGDFNKEGVKRMIEKKLLRDLLLVATLSGYAIGIAPSANAAENSASGGRLKSRVTLITQDCESAKTITFDVVNADNTRLTSSGRVIDIFGRPGTFIVGTGSAEDNDGKIIGIKTDYGPAGTNFPVKMDCYPVTK